MERVIGVIDLLNKPLNVIWTCPLSLSPNPLHLVPVTSIKDSGGLRAGEMYGEETAERQYPRKKLHNENRIMTKKPRHGSGSRR